MSAPSRLFTDCPLPGCRNPVEDAREPCPECIREMGPRLRRRPGRGPSIAEFLTEQTRQQADYERAMAARARLIREAAP